MVTPLRRIAPERPFDISGSSVYDTKVLRVVLDTNVIVAALRSSSGASNQILLAADRGEFQPVLSVPLLAEYDDVTQRPESGIEIPIEAIDAVIGRLAMICHPQPIYYLWRPCLPDPKDDMVLEVAVAANVRYIVSFNTRDFGPAETFGIKTLTPSEFYRSIL